MARTITSAMQSRLDNRYGEEPLNIIEIQWAQNGPRASYADDDVDEIKGRILDMSDLDYVINVDGGSDSAQISIVLSDIDGTLKNLYDNVDFHKRDVWVYQYFRGMDLADKVLIFQGEINSPIVWTEGDRTLSFQVVSKVESAEIGFSIEEGQFVNPAAHLIGVPWPLKFGNTINVPALCLSSSNSESMGSPSSGTLLTGFGISDPTLPFRITWAEAIVCPQVFRGYTSQYFGNPSGGSLQLNAVYTVDEGCALKACEAVHDLKRQLREQKKYEFTQVKILNGQFFPQNKLITLQMKDAKIEGIMVGDVFTIKNARHPDLDDEELNLPLTESKIRAILKARLDVAYEKGCSRLMGGQPDGYGGTTADARNVPKDKYRELAEKSAQSWEFYNAIPKSSFYWIEPGTQIALDTTGEKVSAVYCTNILPETVHYVSAFRNYDNGVRRLVRVPPSYYTVRAVNMHSYNTTEVILDNKLSVIDGTWEDDIFVTSTSSVGPNTVDIMIWLIEKYTQFTWDATSFNYVKERLENYPSDFPLLERKNILEVLREIAYQARCAIYLRDRKFYLVYLSEAPEVVDNFTSSDVTSNSLSCSLTSTEEIVTKLVAEWKKDYSKDQPNKLILRHNVKKYSLQEDVQNFYIYNELSYVQKSATFWLLRRANTWKTVHLSTPIHKLELETFDGCSIELTQFCPTAIRGLITKANYNSVSRTIDFDIWTPVRAGEVTEYSFAWPADIAQTLIFPTEEDYREGYAGSGDIDKGGAPGFTATPPAGHPLNGDLGLAQGFSFGACGANATYGPLGDTSKQTCANDRGDRSPSDQGDEKVGKNNDSTGVSVDGNGNSQVIDTGDLYQGNPVTPGGSGGGAGEKDATLDKLEQDMKDLQADHEKTKSLTNSTNESSGGRGSGTQPDEGGSEPKLPEEPPEGSCRHMLKVFMQVVHLVRPEGGGPTSEGSGEVVSSFPVRTDTLYFDTFCETTQVGNAINQQHAERQASYSYTAGEIFAASAVRIQDSFCFESNQCDRQQQGEGGGNNGYPPLPTAASSEETDSDGESSGYFTDYFNDLSPHFDNSECAKSSEECPPPSDDGGGESDGNSEASTGTESIPAGPEVFGEGWSPGDTGD